VENALFYLMALGAVIGSLGVISAKNPIVSVLSLLGTFFCLAVIYLLAGFQFLAAAQILVYAGAIMVLFLFVIMLLNLGGEQAPWLSSETLRARRAPLAILVSIGFTVLTFVGILRHDEVQAANAGLGEADTIDGLARLLFGSYLLPFEAASVLLLAAAVAVIVLAKREREPRLGGKG